MYELEIQYKIYNIVKVLSLNIVNNQCILLTLNMFTDIHCFRAIWGVFISFLVSHSK